MNGNSYDVVVAKEYEIIQDGRPVKRTAWNRIGRAWRSRSSDSISFELFLIPNQRYVISLREADRASVEPSETTPF